MKNSSNDKEYDYNALEMEKDLKSRDNNATGFNQKISAGLIGRFPNYSGNRVRVRKANRYLAYQEHRILRSINEKKYEKAVTLFLALLKCSKSYQILLFHRVTKVGYGRGSAATTEAILIKSMNKIRRCDSTLLIRRFYIPKANGKMRPIGCPDGPSRMISKAFTDFLNHLTADWRFEGQHAYRKGKGGGSACLSIIEKLKKGMSGYEFDLKSFFNTVEPRSIGNKLARYDKRLTHLIGGILRDVVYRFDKILDTDSEIKIRGRKDGHIELERFGAPQGLSLSPLLCTGAMEFPTIPKDLVFYADDGIVFYNGNLLGFRNFITDMQASGVKIAPEKSGFLDEKFKFCGIEFDSANETVRYNNSTMSWNSPGLEEGLKKAFNYYSKPAASGDWKVNDESFIKSYIHKISGWEKLKTILIGIWKAEIYKGNRYFFGGNSISPILDGSSFCCNELLGVVKYKRNMLTKYGVWKTERKDAVQYTAVLKGKYKNYLNNGNREVIRPDRDYFEKMKGFGKIEQHNMVQVTNDPVVLKKN